MCDLLQHQRCQAAMLHSGPASMATSRAHVSALPPCKGPRPFRRSTRGKGCGPARCEAEAGRITIPQRLNNVPHQRETRQFFYQDACAAVRNAVSARQPLLSVKITIPETNPEMDVYRIGTILELVREIVTDLAADGRKVKVCVQQALGQGVFQGLPLSLSGVRRIMEGMDWGDALQFVAFGNVGADQVDECQHYVLVAPQNVVGSTISTKLQEMAEAVTAQEKTLIILNPQLKDVPSSDGIMGVRGRKERMAFAASFVPAYHFRLLYASNAMVYPIRGALRYTYGGQWEVYKRVDLGKRTEDYQFVGSFDQEPDGRLLTPLFQAKPATTGGQWWNL